MSKLLISFSLKGRVIELCLFVCARGGIRTHKLFRVKDFKSSA